MPDFALHTFEVVARQSGTEIARLTVVAFAPDEALQEARWLLLEEAEVNLFDEGVELEVEIVS